MKDSSHKRHIAKAITWRIIGTIDTVILSWLISGNVIMGLKIGVVEVLSKMILYYLHERAWYNINIIKNSFILNSKKRHLAKTITWRIFGTIDTVVLSFFITGNLFIGLKIGLTEIVTKLLLYYLHERVWYKIDYGLIKRQ